MNIFNVCVLNFHHLAFNNKALLLPVINCRLELFENALAVLREAYSASKESKVSGMRLATGLNNYGYWMKMEGQYNEALVMYQESFEMRERHAGKDDVSTIISLQNIAELLTSMESDDEANIVRKEIMERVERLKQE